MRDLRITIFFSLLFFCSISLSQNKQSTAVDKLIELMNIVNFAYVDSVNMDALSEAAIVSILSELDPHSVYIPEDEVKAMNESLAGSFEGIGVQFDIFRDTILVVTPIPGGPSEKMGIRSGDKIIYASSELISGVGITDEEVIDLLRGERGSKVQISLKRAGSPHLLDFEITRDNIPINSVDAGFMLNEETGYIKINRFARTTHKEFVETLKNLEKEGLQSLVLDLRGNGGGYLYTAVQLADEFLDGKEVIVETRGLKQSHQVFNAKKGGEATKVKLIVLIDEGSASASEIVAGAIQDWDRGIIIGRRSFGKGLVMKPFYLSDGSMVRLTTSRYYTPSGRCIQRDYENGKEEYEQEIRERYENGELFSTDSIDLPKELTFRTMGNRVVYGGGGIMPDLFFPADTTVLGNRYQEFLRHGDIVEFSLQFVEKHRSELETTMASAFEFARDDAWSESILSAYGQFIEGRGKDDLNLDSDLREPLAVQIKAFIGRHVWGSESYYIILARNQELVEKSMDVLDNWNQEWSEISQHTK